jgi:hypothetical protein
MQADWHQLRHDGIDRHRAFLAEAAQRHQMRRIRQEGRVLAGERYSIGAGVQPGGAAVVRWPGEDGAEGCAVFTEREWQRLLFLRWRYRQGQLRD